MNTLKNSWNLSLLYKGDKDPKIENDLRSIEKAFSDFERKYKGKDFTSSSDKLLRALNDYRKLEKILNNHKPWWYFALKRDLNSQDEKASATATKYSQRITEALNKSAFFKIKIADISIKGQQKFLKDRRLATYHYLLKTIFDAAKYKLSEPEEQLENLLSQPGYEMWLKGQSKLLSKQTVKFKGRDLPVPEAAGILSSLPKKERQVLHKQLNKVYLSTSHFAESEINAIFNFKKIMDERRGYKKPYSATVLSYENDEKVIENLVDVVTRGFNISRRFYKLHSRLLGEGRLTLADRGVEIGKIKKKFNFDTAVEIVKRAFSRVDKKYTKIFEEFLSNGQIDVFPKKGKKGGAYCWGGGDNSTYVLLNHTTDIRSVETLAHEMGHAFHTELSKTQPEHYQGYSIAVAETASTFFEQLVVEELEEELSAEEYSILLHNKIMGDISTIFRQIAFFNFELELHNSVREKGELSASEIASLMSKHLKSYLGDAVEVSDEDGYFFVTLSHMRRFFYVYSYAYGKIISRALFEKWKNDNSYSEKIEKFLKAGASMSPEDIFKSIGINTRDPEFFHTGLKAIEKDINKLEELTK